MARSLTWHCCPWCLTEEEKTAARIDQEINKILLEQKKRDRGELKLLLLACRPGAFLPLKTPVDLSLTTKQRLPRTMNKAGDERGALLSAGHTWLTAASFPASPTNVLYGNTTASLFLRPRFPWTYNTRCHLRPALVTLRCPGGGGGQGQDTPGG